VELVADCAHGTSGRDVTIQLRQTGVTWQEVGDALVVLDFDGSVYLQVNGSGRALWERLGEPATEADLVELLRERFGIDESRASSDVRAFVAELRRRDLVVE
jgi:hypothetical protein